MTQDYDATVNSLAKLNISFAGQDDEYYLLCGNIQAQSKLLIHYLLGAELQYDVDDDGLDQLNITNELEPIEIVEDLLTLYNF